MISAIIVHIDDEDAQECKDEYEECESIIEDEKTDGKKSCKKEEAACTMKNKYRKC